MFGYIRLAIGIIIFAFLFWLIMKSKIVRKRKFYVFSGIAAFGVVVALSFLPIENLFITFDSPQAVYQYMKNEKLENEIVIEGEHCDLIVNRKSNNYHEIFAVPKTSDGWKINAGIGFSMPGSYVHDTVCIDLYQYKKTNDYFISVVDLEGGEIEISDKYNTKFYAIAEYNNSLKANYYSYYANISQLDSEYYIVINGKEIKLQDSFFSN